MTWSARRGCRLERAHQVDHCRNRRDQDEQHDRQRRPGPPRAQDLAETGLTERRKPRGEFRIVGGEHALHLLEDALLIHGKRHVSPPPPTRRATQSDGTFLTIPCWKIIYLPMTKG